MNNQKKLPYLFILPGFIIVTTFIYYPVVKNLYWSFYKWSPLSQGRDFVKFSNYIQLFNDEIFIIAIKNNFVHAVISLTIQVFGALVLAAILEDKIFRKISGFLRSMYFIPTLISITVTGLLFSFIYNPQIGLLNEILGLIGLGQFATGWLGNSDTAFPSVIAMVQWIGTGYITMLFVVAIQKIPQDLYDAAIVDGCNKIQKFLYITVPQVKEMTFVAVIFTLSRSMLVFADVFVLTGGGPGYSSQVLSTYLYNSAFINNEMGYASTIAMIIFIITILFYLLQAKIFSE